MDRGREGRGNEEKKKGSVYVRYSDVIDNHSAMLEVYLTQSKKIELRHVNRGYMLQYIGRFNLGSFGDMVRHVTPDLQSKNVILSSQIESSVG